MIKLFRCVFAISLILFGFLPSYDVSAQSPRPARRTGFKGLAVWKAHHGALRETFSYTESVSQLVLYSSGFEISRTPVRIQRYYPNRLRLEMQLGTITRALLFDGANVSAEQGSPPTQSEIELVRQLVQNSIEWVFGRVDAGTTFRLRFEAVAPEDFNLQGRIRNAPRAYDALELISAAERVLVFAHRNNNRIEVLRRWMAGQDIRVEFSDWQAGGSMQLPYKITWLVNGEKKADVIVSRMIVTMR